MIKIKKKYSGITILNGMSSILLNEELSAKMLMHLHVKYKGEYTFISKTKKSNDKDNKGTD